jgi:cell wall integrity and stress response component
MGTPPKLGEVSENRFVVDPDGRSANWDGTVSSAKRRSTLMPVDPRLDPFAKGIYSRSENKSHESVNSLQDNQDYSRRVHEPPRVLRATNPDPLDE